MNENLYEIKTEHNVISFKLSDYFQWYAVPLAFLPKYNNLYNIEQANVAKEQTLSF